MSIFEQLGPHDLSPNVICWECAEPLQGLAHSQDSCAFCARMCMRDCSLHDDLSLPTELRGVDWHSNPSKTLPNSNRARVVPLLHATERAVCTGAVLESENQFGVGTGG